MKPTRRDFLATVGTATFGFFGLDLKATVARADELAESFRYSRIRTTICPYCAVGCGVLVMSQSGKVVRVEGDPDHPINEGTLCPKGASLVQLANNDNRLKQVLYRAPGARTLETIDWTTAGRMIARRIKATRDATFETTNQSGQTVNRTTAIASLGSAALDNETCWLYQKMLRAMGLVSIEHQARL